MSINSPITKNNLVFQTRFTLTSSAKDFEYKVNTTEPIYFMLRLVKKSDTNSSEVFIDDIVIYSNASGTRLVEVNDIDVNLDITEERTPMVSRNASNFKDYFNILWKELDSYETK